MSLVFQTDASNMRCFYELCNEFWLTEDYTPHCMAHADNIATESITFKCTFHIRITASFLFSFVATNVIVESS